MTTSAEETAPSSLGALRVGVEDRPSLARRRRPLRQRLRLPLMLLGPLLVLVGAGYWYLTGGRYVSTDDAYVQAARTSISTDVAGRVAEIDVRDNQKVTAGQVLFRLDQRPFRIAVDEARAQLASVKNQVQAMKATYQQKLADAEANQTTLTYQLGEFERQQRLLQSGTTSKAQYDQAHHAYKLARDRLAAQQQDVAGALAALGGDANIPVDKHPMVMHAQAALDRALLNLSYTVVKAPENGIVTKVEQLQVGDYVTASTPLFSLMSTDRIWVEANFKETELTHMRPGQSATVEVDTYPDIDFPAKVQSLSPGTGLTFALLPAENATGNWVKVVQRLPVRLKIEELDPNAPLHAGLSATVEVDTGYQRPWLGRIQHWFAWLGGGASSTQTAAR
ncbi:MAG TPA: HlyD family secretion protein [Stellaceae bacterium]|jgi:membrane fusion protein (multidrug efflux system)